MCGIVGASLLNPTPEDIDILKRVFLETEIRGKHASGIAWYNGSEIEIIKEGISISELLKKFDITSTVYDNRINLIGHIRYSTSDIHYHQPIGDNTSCIVHNGVISQEDPEKWTEHYGYKCNTRNDTELLYNCVIDGEDYEEKFPGCSVSAITLDYLGNLNYFRNGKRPQWKGVVPSGIIIASTKNILLRAGVTNVEKVQCDNELTHRSYDE